MNRDAALTACSLLRNHLAGALEASRALAETLEQDPPPAADAPPGADAYAASVAFKRALLAVVPQWESLTRALAAREEHR